MSFVQHEPCPRCGSRDNLGRYADGSAWCFGCHYYERAKGAPSALISSPPVKTYNDPPEDICMDFSAEAKAWLDQYGLTIEEIYKRQIRFSPSRNQIIFILDHGVWQARNMSKEAKSKYFTQGNVNDHLPIYRNSCSGTTNVLVLVEDCVSAIKVARQQDAMPLLGSNINHQKLTRLRHQYTDVVFWLDADKFKEAQGLSTRAGLLGLKSRVVFTPNDPKEYNDAEILAVLQEKQGKDCLHD